MKKIRILHMTPPIVRNGIYQYIFNNLKYISKEQFEFCFLMQNPGELMRTEEFQKYGFEIRSFHTVQRENPDQFRKEIIAILLDGYDVLHLHTSYWRGFMIEEIAMELGIPKVIVHSHSSRIDQADEKERIRQFRVHEQLKEQFCDRYATDFWACSSEAADWLYGPQIDRNRIRIMPNAIDIQKFRYCEKTRNTFRRKNHLEGKFVIGHTGRFEYQKNHGFLIKIFQQIHKKFENAVLVLVGEGAGEGQIRNMVREYGLSGSVMFPGWSVEIEQWLQAFDVYCLPSLFEGLPVSLVEAQTAGLKCICSNRVTKEAGITENVCFLEPDVREWAKAISQYAAGYKREDVSGIIKSAGYDLKDQVKILEHEYKKCCMRI